jgi:hypothetical protein
VEPTLVAAEYIEVTMRDQYISRSDMWHIKQSLVGHCVFVSKKITFSNGLRVQVREIFRHMKKATCGYITHATKVIFRSESARVYLMIQMAEEMWQFTEDGDLFFEKAVDHFLPQLFSKWKMWNTNHLVTILLFTRVLYDHASTEMDVEEGSFVLSSFSKSGPFSNTTCMDHYKVLIDMESRSDWSTVLRMIKQEFQVFAQSVLQSTKGETPHLRGRIAPAYIGNVLEAVNLALNPHDRHYIDKEMDFLRTGLSFMVITPGTGYFETDKCLLRLTTQRILDNGVGLDLICLSSPPLHCAPLFGFTSKFSSNEQLEDRRLKEKRGDTWDPLYFDDQIPENPEYFFFSIPEWVDLSYFYLNHCSGFQSRCRMLSMHLSSHDQDPFLPKIGFVDDLETYDENLFHGADRGSRNAALFSQDEDSSVPGSVKKYGVSFVDGDSPLMDHFIRRKALAPYQPVCHRMFAIDATLRPMLNNGPLPEEDTEGLSPSNPLLNSNYVNFSSYNIPRVGSDSSMSRLKTLPMMSVSPTPSYMLKSQGNGRWEHGKTNDMGFGSRRVSDAFSKPLVNRDGDPAVVHPYRDAPPFGDPIHSANYNSPPRSRTVNINSETEFAGPGSLPGSFLGGPSPRKLGQLAGIRSNESTKAIPIGYLQHSLVPPTYERAGSSQVSGILNRNSRPNLINPWNPLNNTVRLSSHLQRWHHVYPPLINVCIAAPKWNSLCTPASLPITTDSFPSNDELLELYQEYTYSVSPNDESGLDFPSARLLLSEMISLRLSQGFQVVHSHYPNAMGHSAQSSDTENSQEETYLSMGHHVHKISVMSEQTVEVKRYVRKLDYLTRSIKYKYHLWNKDERKYFLKATSFNYPQLVCKHIVPLLGNSFKIYCVLCSLFLLISLF